MWVQRGVEGLQGGRDPITAVAAAPHMLLIGRASGEVLVYTLPDLVPAGNATLPSFVHPSDAFFAKTAALHICSQPMQLSDACAFAHTAAFHLCQLPT